MVSNSSVAHPLRSTVVEWMCRWGVKSRCCHLLSHPFGYKSASKLSLFENGVAVVFPMVQRCDDPLFLIGVSGAPPLIFIHRRWDKPGKVMWMRSRTTPTTKWNYTSNIHFYKYSEHSFGEIKLQPLSTEANSSKTKNANSICSVFNSVFFFFLLLPFSVSMRDMGPQFWRDNDDNNDGHAF